MSPSRVIRPAATSYRRGFQRCGAALSTGGYLRRPAAEPPAWRRDKVDDDKARLRVVHFQQLQLYGLVTLAISASSLASSFSAASFNGGFSDVNIRDEGRT